MGDPKLASLLRKSEAIGITFGFKNEKEIGKHLYTKGFPDPDLIIRTGGESRLSNFLLWQSAYAELMFFKKPWPEFTEEDFFSALLDYKNRERRFGGK